MKPLKVITVERENAATAAAKYMLADLQTYQFFNQPAALLLSGGSNIRVAAKLANLIDANQNLSQLHVMLADERVGVAANDLNENQLQAAGVWSTLAAKGAQVLLLSQFKNENITKRTTAIAKDYQKVFAQTKQVVLLAGMGDDGHTAGILPTTQASKFKQLFDIKQLVSYYQVNPDDSDNPYTQRLTINLTAMKQITKAYLYCVGSHKLPMIYELQQQTQLINRVPALSLFTSIQPVTLLTDQTL